MNQYPQIYRPVRSAPVPESRALIPEVFLRPGISVLQLLSILRAYLRLSVAIVVAVLALTVLLLTLWPRTYTATATLMVRYEVNDPLAGKDLPLGQVGSYIATQVELLRTPGVLLAVVDRLGMTQRTEYLRGYRPGAASLRQWVADRMATRLAVYPSQIGSQLIYVGYSASSAVEAAQVANAVADVFQAQERARSAGPPGERARRNAEELADLKAKVDKAQGQLSGFHERRGLLEDGAKQGLDAMLLGNLEGRLLEAQNARREAAERAQQQAASSDLVLASPQVQAIRSQLAAQELQLAQLARIDGPSNPSLREAQSRVADLRRALAAATQGYADNAQATLRMAEGLERKLQAAVAAQRSSSAYQSRLRDESARYQLEFDSAQEVYKRALDDSDRIRFVAASGPYANVDVVSAALPPLTATAPRLLRGAALGILAAGLLGLGVPLLLEHFRRRVRCRDDLEREFGIPVLAECPAFLEHGA